MSRSLKVLKFETATLFIAIFSTLSDSDVLVASLPAPRVLPLQKLADSPAHKRAQRGITVLCQALQFGVVTWVQIHLVVFDRHSAMKYTYMYILCQEQS